jgi:aspartyl-tRNA(Asn)/glutamyl-tRNA(Gln) amidotransferase subunit C
MGLTSKEVQHIANLARLEVSDEQIDDYVEKLTQILDLVDALKGVDTTDLLPLAHPLQMNQRLRADKPTEKNQRDLFQRNAENVEQGLYSVPRVIE